MERLVVLLRGVNVGGRHKLPMAALRTGLESAGCADVVTYIQSGNAVISPPDSIPDDMTAWLETVIAEIARFEAAVVIRSAAEMRQVIDRNPYPGADGKQLHVRFFAQPPSRDTLAAIEPDAHAPESFTLLGRDLYIFLPDGMGSARLPQAIDAALRQAGSEHGTTRNWNTVNTLCDLAV